MPEETVGLFCRISPSVREVLAESLRGINASRGAGEAQMSLGVLVERCIVEALTADPSRLPLPRRVRVEQRRHRRESRREKK